MEVPFLFIFAGHLYDSFKVNFKHLASASRLKLISPDDHENYKELFKELKMYLTATVNASINY